MLDITELFMKTRRIPMITKLWLAVVLVLVLLPSLAIAEARASLNEQLIAAAERVDSALVNSLVNKGADLNAKDATAIRFSCLLPQEATWS
jgi:hypothetical protein